MSSTLLKTGKLSIAEKNGPRWKERIISEHGPTFGRMIGVCKEGKKFDRNSVLPPIKEKDYLPENVEGLSDADIAGLRMTALKARVTRVQATHDKEQLFYETLLSECSYDSQQKMAADQAFGEISTDMDPYELWLLIEKIHFTEECETNPALKLVNEVKKENAFESLRMPRGMPLEHFKKEFDTKYTHAVSLGMAETDPAKLAIKFLLKLDEQRFGSLRTELENVSLAGSKKAYPKTVQLMYDFTSRYKNPVSAAAHSSSGGSTLSSSASTFVVEEKLKSKPNVETTSEPVCWYCGSKFHKRPNCPDFAKQKKKSVAEKATSNNAAANKTAAAGTKVFTTVGENQTTSSTYDDPGDADDWEFYDCNFVTTLKTLTTTSAKQLFEDTDILLDSQAGEQIFWNKELFSELKPIKRHYLGGVNDNEKGIMIDKAGNFEEYGVVSQSDGAVANILSQPILVDLGFIVEYQLDRDIYVLSGKGTAARVFHRNFLKNGAKSKHYTCNWLKPTRVADHAIRIPEHEVNTVLVNTVANNLKYCTKRDLVQIKRVQDLSRKLGHPTTSGLLSTLKGGVDNSEVSTHDVQLEAAVHGQSAAAKVGCTKQKTPKKSSGVALPRLTQEPQIMHCDLFFIKEMAFLLAIIAPAAYIMVIHCRNKTVDLISRGIKYFIAKCKSRNFDVVNIVADGEKAIGAMKTDLERTGIEVDIRGAGQHAEVAERTIETVKQRVRTYENVLPFVMSSIVLIFCVLFCTSRINLQPSTTCTAGISPNELFTGMRLNVHRDLRCGFGDYVHATLPTTDNTMKPRTEGCVCLYPTGNSTGSVKMLCLQTQEVVTRDQFQILPMPNQVITQLNFMAAKDGLKRPQGTPINISSDIYRSENSLDDVNASGRETDQINIRTEAGVDNDAVKEYKPYFPASAEEIAADTGPSLKSYLENVPGATIEDYISSTAEDLTSTMARVIGERKRAGDFSADGPVVAAASENNFSEPDNFGGEQFSGEAEQNVAGDELPPVSGTPPVAEFSNTQSHETPSPSRNAESGVSGRNVTSDVRGAGQPRRSERQRVKRNVLDYTDLFCHRRRFIDENLVDCKNYTLTISPYNDTVKSELSRQMRRTSQWRDKTFAFVVSVRAAMRDRREEAEPVVDAEMKQMLDKKVWHPVRLRDLSREERKSVIRSSMFMKDKFTPSGQFEKYKARLVAGGDQQDKRLYENLSSPTASTTSLFTVAAIAASENRHVTCMDIGGAYLNADMSPTGVRVRMRLDKLLSSILIRLDKSYESYVEKDGTMVVELDKALYGCVEAAALWYNDLSGKLLSYGFQRNEYDSCVYNMIRNGEQVTIVLHVDDLLVTSRNLQHNMDLLKYLKEQYNGDVKHSTGKVIEYVGMIFDFSVDGEVSVTMDHAIDKIIESGGVTTSYVTPATENLFEIRDVEKVGQAEREYFHTHIAKVLYVAKRVKPECLTAVSFLTSRVHECDTDDMAKLKRLLGYIRGTSRRGITFRIGESMGVRAYIDAAYGVHTSSGKSHTGCVLVLGEGGPVYAKSGKQKIVTKSSTEAELVGLSDTASQAIHLRNFIISQGYDVGPAIIYQDNLSCMALMKRGGPGSERSRHIHIRHFWLKERVDNKEVIVEHLGTKEMSANVLTKPVQGQQFVAERLGLTNWK